VLVKIVFIMLKVMYIKRRNKVMYLMNRVVMDLFFCVKYIREVT